MLSNSINKALLFLKDWTLGTIGDGINLVGKGLKNIFIGNTGSSILYTFSLDSLTGIFIVVAMIGIFISMAGNKKLGTKLSSLSFIIYIFIKAVLGC